MLECCLMYFLRQYMNTEKSCNKNFNTWSTKEPFSSKDNHTSDTVSTIGFFGFFFLIIFIIFIGIPITIGACYLSWTSNTIIEWGKGFKVLFAFFAFLAPSSYLLSHLIHKYDLLTYIEKQKLSHNVVNIQ